MADDEESKNKGLVVIGDIEVSDNSISALSDRMKKMKAFVKDQMEEGLDRDYAIIPYTTKPSLLKAGAEKLLLLFKVGFRYEILHQNIDLVMNEISFMVRAVFYRKTDGFVIGEHIGYASNQEAKFQHFKRADGVHTLLSMAQKRALVGGARSVTGASDYFTSDTDDMDENDLLGNQNKKTDGNKFIDANRERAGEFVITFGQYKNKKIKDLSTHQVTSYINYILENAQDGELKPQVKGFVDKGREYLRESKGEE